MAYWLHCQTCKKWTKSNTPLSIDSLCSYCNSQIKQPKQVIPAKIENSFLEQASKTQTAPIDTLTNEKEHEIEALADIFTGTEDVGKELIGFRGTELANSEVEETRASELPIEGLDKIKVPGFDLNELKEVEESESDIGELDKTELPEPDRAEINHIQESEPDVTESERLEICELNIKEDKNIEIPESDIGGFDELDLLAELPKAKNSIKKEIHRRKEIPSPPLRYLQLEEVKTKSIPAHKISIESLKNLE